jgi:hypothetical protein
VMSQTEAVRRHFLLLAVLKHIDFRECFKMVAIPQIKDSDPDKASGLPGLPNLWPANPQIFRNTCTNTTTGCETFQCVLSVSLR